MEAVFVKSYELTYSHIDWRGVARPAAYFDFMQDAATVHAHMAHLDSGALSAIWVLSRIHAEFEHPLVPYDIVQVSTWCAGIKGASWLRAFAFAVHGEPVGRAISSWVILDYTAETPPNARLELCAARAQETFSVCGVSDDCVRFQAAGTFGRLSSDR